MHFKLLSFLLCIHILRDSLAKSQASDGNERKPIFDLTKPIDEFLNKGQINASLIAAALKISPDVFYFADLNFFNMLRFKIKKVSDLIVKISSKLKVHSERPPKILMSVKYTAKVIDDPLGVVSFPNFATFFASKPLGLLNHTSGIIFDWADKQSCTTWGGGISVIRQARVWLLLHYQISSLQMGFGYNEVHVPCRNFLLNQLKNADYILLTIDFESGVKFPESYGLFEEYMNSIVERNQKLVRQLSTYPSVIYRPRLHTHGHGDREEFERSYHSLLSRFSSTWALNYKHRVILETTKYASDILQGCQHGADSAVSNFSDTVIVSVSNVLNSEFKEESSKCLDFSVESVFSAVGNTFSFVFLNIGIWTQMLSCQLHTTTTHQLPGPAPTILLDIDWETSQDKSLQTLSFFIDKHKKESGMPLKAVIFRRAYLDFLSEDAQRYQQLVRFRNQWPALSLGCLLEFGPLEGYKHSTNLAKISKENCKLAEAQNSTNIYVWEFNIDFNSVHKSSYSFTHFVETVQKALHQVYIYKEDLTKDPNSEVILKINALKSTTRLKNDFTQALYCDQTALKMNQYYEALITWADIHDLRIILKEGVQNEDSLVPGWYDKLSPPSNMISQGKDFFAMRNYPKTMAYLNQSSCLNWTSQVTKQIPFHTNYTGIAVSTNISDQSLRPEELHTMMQFAFQKFTLVELEIPQNDKEVGDVVKTIINLFAAPITNWNNLQKLFIQFPLMIPLKKFSLEGQLRSFKDLAKALAKLPFQMKGIHIANWERYRNNQKVIESLQSMMSYGARKQIEVGLLLQDCTGEVNNATERTPRNISYIVCNDSPQPERNEDKITMAKYLEGHLVTKMYLEKAIPRVKVYFRLNSTPAGGNEKENTISMLKFLNDVNQFAGVYKVEYFTCLAFETISGSKRGWWRIEDFTDLYNSSVYFERESEILNIPFFRPATPSSWNETFYSKLIGQKGVWSAFVPIMITCFTIALLTITTFSIFLAVRLRRKERFLSNAEVKEFFFGGDTNINMSKDASGEAKYVGMEFCVEFEIPKGSFKLESSSCILGVGNFGTVYKAQVNGRDAAVKVPLVGCSKDTFRSMLFEVKILCYIGEHENVIKFIGCYTKEISEGVIYIVTTLCENGCLQGYLRRKHKAIKEGATPPMHFQEFVKMSREIASGMDYIASKSVVHADLSTRNVLLDEHNTCKIGDFGLSRKLYEFNKYVKKNEEPLPWRWMAYESLKKMEFTTKSDVWSYGVTLWEIFSLGDVPYPGLNWTVDFVESIKNGMRMIKPEYSTDEIYSKMFACWNIDPDERPTFQELGAFFLAIRNIEYAYFM